MNRVLSPTTNQTNSDTLGDAVTTEKLAKMIVEQVRDESIEQWLGNIDGQMKGATAKKVRSLLKNWSPEELAVLKQLVPAIVDTVLHRFMWAIEQDPEVRLSYGNGPQLRDTGDGLPGDLVTWREKYSHQPVFDPFDL